MFLRKIMSVSLLLSCLAGSSYQAGCSGRAPREIELFKAASPDAFWLAFSSATPGDKAGDFSIYLQQNDKKRHPVDSLLFPGPWRPVKIVEFSATPGHVVASRPAEMKWVANRQIEVTYDPVNLKPVFEVVRCAGVRISVRPLPYDGPTGERH